MTQQKKILERAEAIKDELRAARTRDEIDQLARRYGAEVRAMSQEDDPGPIMAIHIRNLAEKRRRDIAAGYG